MTEARHGSRRGPSEGLGGHLGAPSAATIIEARHGPAGARRVYGGWGPSRGPHHRRRSSRRPTAPPGRDEYMGGWGPSRGPSPAMIIETRHGSAGARRVYGGLGAISGPITGDDHRDAPRLRRGATSIWGVGGHLGAHHRRRS